MILLDLYGSLWISLPWGGGLGEVLSHFASMVCAAGWYPGFDLPCL